jgi:hypothetical protein
MNEPGKNNMPVSRSACKRFSMARAKPLSAK